MRLIQRIALLTLLIVALPMISFSQNYRNTFEEGKALFDRGQYALVVSKLAPITSLDQDNDMVRYASFYYAVSAYRSNDPVTAKSMFMQISQRFSSWPMQDEVNFWLGKINFEQQNYREAINFLDLILNNQFSDEIQRLKDYHFGQITDMDLLTSLLTENPNESVLASQLANQILKKEVADQDIDLLDSLASRYDLKLDLGIDGIEDSPKKSMYNVGVFLPFTFRNDSVRLERIQQEWTVRFYEGVKIGLEKLSEEGVYINVVAFDTRSNEVSLDAMLQTEEARSLDLIIGPVFQSAVLKVSAFAKEQRINMLNPLSSNSEIINNNPFAFLYNPSNESLAIAAAEYAKKHFTHNKNVAIFYSGIGDRPRADLYKELIEKDSFNIPIFQLIRPQESSLIQQILVEEEEVDKDSAVVAQMMAEMDSLREAGEEQWEIYTEQDFVYDTLLILPDSIGHIFVASDVASLSASTVSAIEARPDTIQYISSTSWLSSEQSISFSQLERIGAIFTGSNWIDYGTPEVAEFRERYEFAFNAYPSKADRLGDAYMGYDIIVTYGRLLGQYGKYFQLGLKRRESINGELTGRFDYRFSNDNRNIPIYRVIDSQVVPINKIPDTNDEN